MSRSALLVAGSIFVVGFLGAWVGAVPFDDEERCPLVRYPETTLLRHQPTLTPPGATRCEYTLPSGTRLHTTYVPWRSWLAILLGAAAVAMVVSATAARGIAPRAWRLAAAALAVTVSFCIVFGLV